MDLRGLANGVSSTRTRIKPCVYHGRRATPSAPAAIRCPTRRPLKAPARYKALDGKDLQQLDGSTFKAPSGNLFARGAGWRHSSGRHRGDLVETADGQTWLVVKVLESWPTGPRRPLCCKGVPNVRREHHRRQRH